MWIFTNNAFFSIVKHRTEPSMVMVRARVKGDLEKVFGTDVDVSETTDSDYRFRITAPQQLVAELVKNQIEEIDYANFKNSIGSQDHLRQRYYANVWSIMDSWQELIHPRD
jgi:hypothetical protein